jgi:hypothetical protein
MGAWPVCGAHAHDGGSTVTVSNTTPVAPRHANPVPAPAIPLPHTAPKHAAPDTDPPTTLLGPVSGYQIASGDTLASIADAHQIPGGWQALVDANRDTITDPDVIPTGGHLNIPTTTDPGTTDILTSLIAPVGH